MFFAFKIIGTFKSALFCVFEPITGCVLGVIFFKEEITAIQIAGVILALIVTVIAIVEENKLEKELREDERAKKIAP